MKHYKIPLSLLLPPTIPFLQTCLILKISNVSAQLLSPSDMAVGRWNLALNRRDRFLLESMVFPTREQISPSSSKITHNDSKRRRRRLDCELILDSDGTFTLMPPSCFGGASDVDATQILKNSVDEETLEESNERETNESEISRGDKENQNQHVIDSKKHQPLRGIWKLNPNPYCVTDRQYDELILKSIPKVRMSLEQQDAEEDEGMKPSKSREKIIVELNCNVWGRFGSNPIRHMLKRPRGKDAGRLTHGTLSIVKTTTSCSDDDSGITDSIRRVICGTFNARSAPLQYQEAQSEMSEEEEEETASPTNSQADIGYGLI